MSPRLFTVEEANALIPKLEMIMAALQRHRVTLRDRIAELARETGMDPETFTAHQVLELCPDLQPVFTEVAAALTEIESYGGEVKGLEMGLVDFLGEVEGEVVCLCWQYGEKEIAYYHSQTEGFGGRRPLKHVATTPRYLQ